jgi:hypothetical protein
VLVSAVLDLAGQKLLRPLASDLGQKLRPVALRQAGLAPVVSAAQN